MDSPIEEALAAVDRWLEDLDVERDRAARLRAALVALRDEPPMLFPQRPRRALPTAMLQLLPARQRKKLA